MRRTVSSSMPSWTNCNRRWSRLMHLQRAVAGVDQIGRRVHDRAQGGVQLQSGRDQQHRLHQPVETVTPLDHQLNVVLHLGQQLAQTQLRQSLAQRAHSRVGLVPRRLRRSHGHPIRGLLCAADLTTGVGINHHGLLRGSLKTASAYLMDENDGDPGALVYTWMPLVPLHGTEVLLPPRGTRLNAAGHAPSRRPAVRRAPPSSCPDSSPNTAPATVAPWSATGRR